MSFVVPEYQKSEEFRGRSGKLAEIRALGIDPYPPKYLPTHSAEQLAKLYEGKEVGHSDDAAAGSTAGAAIAGRLVLLRPMGKNAFAQIQDGSGRIQLMCSRDITEVHGFAPTPELSPLKFIEKKLDLGDIIGAEGYLFRTQKGELTLLVKRLTLLCKTLLPLPDKHSGLADKGVRYRKRWLDLITHADVTKQLRLRSQIIQEVRRYFERHGFMEVETPVLQNLYGGALARPFTTHLHALDQEMYLRISLEISLKKLIVGGMERIFEIGKVFRNEGLDRTHNPEFTMLEAYGAYLDYNDMMTLTENLFEELALHLFGTTVIPLQLQESGPVHQIDLKAPWKRLSMKESIRLFAGLDTGALSEQEMRQILREKTSATPKEIGAASRGLLIALLFKELVEPHLIQPHHIIDHPIETTPLCKLHRSPELRSMGIVERFESFIATQELCNSYTELNDPQLQRELLVEQANKRLSGDEEAHPLDEEFLEAISQGMPPTGGLGIGIDRLVMLFTGAHSIRDVLYFPLMRPEEA